MNIREHAKKYLSLGFSVIPILPGSKRPKIKWQEFQSARMKPEDAERFFDEGDNIALVCGDVSGVLVVDSDAYKKKTDTASDPLRLVSPLRVVTPRGGVHFYFKYREGTGNTANHEYATDIRSKGGYVLIPPSVVALDGGAKSVYAWTQNPTGELLESLPEVDNRVLNALYGTKGAEMIEESRLGVSVAPRPFHGRFTGSQNQAVYSGSRFDPSSIVGLGEGSRNDQLHRTALHLLNHHDAPEAWRLTLAYNGTFSPPLPEGEVRALFESAKKRVAAHPKQKPPRGESRAYRHMMREGAHHENKEFRMTTSEEDFAEALKTYVEGKQIGIQTAYAGLNDLTGGLHPGQMYLVYADTNVGKSMFVVNVLVDLAKRGTRCLYFDLENARETTFERMMFSVHAGAVSLDEWRKALDARDADRITELAGVVKPLLQRLHVWELQKISDRFGDVTWAGVRKVIEEECAAENPPTVIAIDHVHYFCPGETDHAVLAEITRELNNISANMKVAILLVAHTRKGLSHADRKDGKVTAVRPTMDFVNGSGLITKHSKNVIAIKRNAVSDDPIDRCETTVYVDKTKWGPAGFFNLVYNEKTLRFEEKTSPRALDALSPQLREEAKTRDDAREAWREMREGEKKDGSSGDISDLPF